MSVEPTEQQVRLGLFWRKYLRLTRGGVPTLRAFAVLAEEQPDPALREVGRALARGLEEGLSLSEGMQRFPEVFSLSAIELVRAAERHGAWEDALTELADGLLDGTFH